MRFFVGNKTKISLRLLVEQRDAYFYGKEQAYLGRNSYPVIRVSSVNTRDYDPYTHQQAAARSKDQKLSLPIIKLVKPLL